jgi:hypothetical protein
MFIAILYTMCRSEKRDNSGFDLYTGQSHAEQI